MNVANGIVRLKGQTSEATHKEWAAAIANRTEGVVVVVNKIQVVSSVDFSQSWAVISESLSQIGQDILTRLPSLLAAGVFC